MTVSIITLKILVGLVRSKNNLEWSNQVYWTPRTQNRKSRSLKNWGSKKIYFLAACTCVQKYHSFETKNIAIWPL
jgi:hypothetical protein